MFFVYRKVLVIYLAQFSQFLRLDFIGNLGLIKNDYSTSKNIFYYYGSEIQKALKFVGQ